MVMAERQGEENRWPGTRKKNWKIIYILSFSKGKSKVLLDFCDNKNSKLPSAFLVVAFTRLYSVLGNKEGPLSPAGVPQAPHTNLLHSSSLWCVCMYMQLPKCKHRCLPPIASPPDFLTSLNSPFSLCQLASERRGPTRFLSSLVGRCMLPYLAFMGVLAT